MIFIQPVLMMTSRVPGLLYINGRPVGETGGDDAVVVPVAPRGAVYIEHRPMTNGYLPLTRRLTISGGRVLVQSVDETPGLSVVLWPDGAAELAIEPERVLGEPEIELQGTPADPGAVAMDDGSVRLIEDLMDTVGHARLSIFQPVDGAWQSAHSELLWTQGAPRWPDSPEATALAALEAWFLGLSEEAYGYCTPAAAQRLAEIVPDDALGCVPMRHPAPGGQTAIGLVRFVNAQCAQVVPLNYTAMPMGGPQGTWRIGDVSVETQAAY